MYLYFPPSITALNYCVHRDINKQLRLKKTKNCQMIIGKYIQLKEQ